MRISGRVQLSLRLLALLFLVGVIALAASGTSVASAATVSQPQTIRPLVGCAPCISSLDPGQNGTVKADASGQVTLTFQAQMVNPFVQFVLTLDGTAIDSKKIQVTADDPLQPTGTYKAALSAGAHTASVEADDADGSEAVFVGWNFTVEASAATPVPTKTPVSNPQGTSTPTTGNTDTTGTGGSSSGASPTRTLSIVLFAIAGVGLLVMAFIAGMWFNGRQLLNRP